MKTPTFFSLRLLSLAVSLAVAGCAHLPPPAEKAPPIEPPQESPKIAVAQIPQTPPSPRPPLEPFLDLSKALPQQSASDWMRLEPIHSTSNIAFQNKNNAAIISLNRVCAGTLGSGGDLKGFSRKTLKKVTNISEKSETSRELFGVPVLETTLQGTLAGERMKLRALVFKKDKCFFDVMLVSRPQSFSENESLYSRFIESLQPNRIMDAETP